MGRRRSATFASRECANWKRSVRRITSQRNLFRAGLRISDRHDGGIRCAHGLRSCGPEPRCTGIAIACRHSTAAVRGQVSAVRTGPLPFRFEFELAGSDSLHFLPLGASTTVNAQINWPHPDFDGAFLPISHVFTANGYSASWNVLEINRAIPQMWRGGAISHSALLSTAFGVRLFQPSDIYSRNYRAVRYGMGLALATFYLVLLALSEHVGAGLAASYTALYAILLSEDYALLYGSLLIFAILATLMLATRKLRWNKVGRADAEQP